MKAASFGKRVELGSYRNGNDSFFCCCGFWILPFFFISWIFPCWEVPTSCHCCWLYMRYEDSIRPLRGHCGQSFAFRDLWDCEGYWFGLMHVDLLTHWYVLEGAIFCVNKLWPVFKKNMLCLNRVAIFDTCKRGLLSGQMGLWGHPTISLQLLFS